MIHCLVTAWIDYLNRKFAVSDCPVAEPWPPVTPPTCELQGGSQPHESSLSPLIWLAAPLCMSWHAEKHQGRVETKQEKPERMTDWETETEREGGVRYETSRARGKGKGNFMLKLQSGVDAQKRNRTETERWEGWSCNWNAEDRRGVRRSAIKSVKNVLSVSVLTHFFFLFLISDRAAPQSPWRSMVTMAFQTRQQKR